MTAPEFSRRILADGIGDGGRDVAIEATADERAALARRFGLIALDRLEARLHLTRRAGLIHAEGVVEADATQPCVVTGEPVRARIEESVQLRFVDTGPDGDEIELSEADCDTIPLDAGAADIGEAAAETMMLALPPFPRSDQADVALRRAGVLKEGAEPRGPFAALAALRGSDGDGA